MFNNSWKDPLEGETVSQRRERTSKKSKGSIRSADSIPVPASIPISAPRDVSRPSRFGRFGDLKAFRRFSKVDDDCFDTSSNRRVSSASTEASILQSPLEPNSISAIAELPAAQQDEARKLSSAPPRAFNPDEAKQLVPNAIVSPPVPARNHRRNTDPGGSPLLNTLYEEVTRRLEISRALKPVYSSKDPPPVYTIPKPVVRRKPPANPVLGSLSPAPIVEHVTVEATITDAPLPPDRPIPAAQPTQSTHGTYHQQDQKTPFQKTLHRMEIAGNQILCSRLRENWYIADPKVREEISFEKRLWALTALEAVGTTTTVTEMTAGKEGRKDILHLYGHAADGWRLAANNPSAIVHSIPSRFSPFPSPDDLTWGPPPTNLNQLSAPLSVGRLPYPASFFDVIFTDSPYTTHRSYDVPALLQECVRVLKPGGCIVVTVLSPMPHPVGPLLQGWMFSNLFLGLERKFSVTQPSQLLAALLKEILELTQFDVKTFAFPAVLGGGAAVTATADTGDALSIQTVAQDVKGDLGQLKSIVGLFFYFSLYEHFLSDVPSLTTNPDTARTATAWWWEDTAIVNECKEQRSMFELLTYCYQKKHQN